MQIEIIFTVLFFLLFIFAKLKQLLFCGWSLKLNHSPCDEVFSYVRFGRQVGRSLTGSDWRGAGRKASTLLCRIVIFFFSLPNPEAEELRDLFLLEVPPIYREGEATLLEKFVKLYTPM